MRLASWLFIVFQVVWLNVVLPGHTRGIITLSGASSSSVRTVETPSCCSAAPSTPGKDSPTPEQKKNCALCYFAAGLALPPVLSFDHILLDVAELLPSPAQAQAVCLSFPLPYDALAPPA